tara:strand:+ start:296 stop:1066 length:771 start_codon:yes stop_codon:yes gene_type:complete
MKKYLLSGFLLSIISIHINSADYEMRSEFIYCNLNDGKTLNDAAEQAREYGKFSEAAGTKYIQSMLVPIHAGQHDYDYILWGSWPDGKAMYQEWGSYLNDYDESFTTMDEDSSSESASECKSRVAAFHTGVISNTKNMSDPDKRKPVQFAGCTLKDGVSLNDVHEFIEKDGKMMTEFGFTGWARGTFSPYLGFKPDYPYDFVDMIFWHSFDERGNMANNYGDFVEKHPDLESGYNDLVECAPSNSFYNELLFDNLD